MKDLLKEGEIICPKCHGEDGAEPYSDEECSKCYGEGKLDWIENIVGKPKPINPYEEFMRRAANELRDSIDKEFIDNLVSESNK